MTEETDTMESPEENAQSVDSSQIDNDRGGRGRESRRAQRQSKSIQQSRRRFLATIGGVTATGVVAGAMSPFIPGSGLSVEAAEVGPVKDKTRIKQALAARQSAASAESKAPPASHLTNGDEEAFAAKIGNFSKGLPHNALGEPDINSYNKLIAALTSGNPSDFASITTSGAAKLVDPQASYAFEMEGADSHHLTTPAPPAFSSAEEAGEMVELYWHALMRDVPFSEYDTSPLPQIAATDLSAMSDFRGPKVNGVVTPDTLFRGDTAGDLAGPYVSQFLLKTIPFGAIPVLPLLHTAAPAVDFMTQFSDWANIQNGGSPATAQLDPTARYIRNGRDLTAYVHSDFSYQAHLTACVYLLSLGTGIYDPANPYKTVTNQSAFSTFGAPFVVDLVATAANRAIDAAWFQKWLVHRRLRPEEFGARVHNVKTAAASYPVHSDVLKSIALETVFSKNGAYLLPQAYPEGCPMHPSYPAAHAVIAGACVTMLKAFFDESAVVPGPVFASPDGLGLESYTGPATLTVGGELNKLAANIAIARDFAGVHWRSDGIQGLALGEAVAISVLSDRSKCFNEPFSGFSLTKFDGTTTTVM